MQERFKKKDETLVEVSDDGSGIHGTSADLLAGDTLTIWQLMYGLMLPSGNDAAFTLAEYFGGLLQKAAQEEEEQIRKEEDQKRKEAIKLKAESDNKDDSQQINEGGDLPTASTNHT